VCIVMDMIDKCRSGATTVVKCLWRIQGLFHCHGIKGSLTDDVCPCKRKSFPEMGVNITG
jgi:hypothetical protein